MAYVDLLKDPRWQRLRLEIFQRDGWACRECNSAQRTLHIHHRRYRRGLPPWESPPDDLITLCDSCHDKMTTLTRQVGSALGALPMADLEFAASLMRASGAPIVPRAEQNKQMARLSLAHVRREMTELGMPWTGREDQISAMAQSLLENDSPLLDHVLDDILPPIGEIGFEPWIGRLFTVALRMVRTFIEMRREVLGIEPSPHETLRPPQGGR